MMRDYYLELRFIAIVRLGKIDSHDTGVIDQTMKFGLFAIRQKWVNVC